MSGSTNYLSAAFEPWALECGKFDMGCALRNTMGGEAFWQATLLSTRACWSAQFDFHAHMVQHVRWPRIAAADRRDLVDTSTGRDRHKVETTNAAVGRVKGDPGSAGYKDLRPGMGGPGHILADEVFLPVVEIPRDDPRAEAETARCLDEQHREIAA